MANEGKNANTYPKIPMDSSVLPLGIKNGALYQIEDAVVRDEVVGIAKLGAPNGIAPLDADSKVPNENLSFGKVEEGNLSVVSGGGVYDMVGSVIYRRNKFSINFVLNDMLISQNIPSVGKSTLVHQVGAKTLFCVLDKNKTYTISGVDTVNSIGKRSAIFNSNEVGSIGTNNDKFTFTTTNDNYVFCLGIQYQGGSVTDVSKVQIEEGKHKTRYKNYSDTNIKSDNKTNSSLMVGASFAFDGNVWYKESYDYLGGIGINKAVSGHSINDIAVLIRDNKLYNISDLDSFNHLVIYLTHNVDVFGGEIRDTLSDYESNWESISNSGFWDYILKKYYSDCRALQNNAESTYYNVPYGKPVSIVVFTHWHDGRVIFNDSIRKLRDKWGFNLIELDRKIGFSKEQLNPVSKDQISKMYAVDLEQIGNSVYGWHPLREGEVLYVQDRTRDVFINTIEGK